MGLAALTAGLVVLSAGCAGTGGGTRSQPPSSPASSTTPTVVPSAVPSEAGATSGQSGPVTLAFGGDANAEGSAGSVLRRGMGATGEVLRSADIALVNLETAIAQSRSGLVGQPKQFTFLAPPSYLDMLARTGVDAVSVANNHGLDFGRNGLDKTLAARSPDRPTMIGIGADDTEAWKPWTTTVRGRRVVVFAASDVLDAGFDWAAGPGRSGMALTKTEAQYERVRSAVRQARQEGPGDGVVVFLHAGVERVVCPTDRQRQLARDLSADGADVVAMSHAHVMQPATVLGNTAVIYGLGNFVFASQRAESARTGVVTVRLEQGRPPVIDMHSATIRSGVPVLDSGAALGSATRRWEGLMGRC
ncbi:MAG TPA: CapA family protein [Dermatophilaceae bacterium]|nr:CapA family protein [Dermatophilaceae bacterium]